MNRKRAAKILTGVSVIVTRPKDKASDLTQRLKSLGANVLHAPLIRSAEPSSWRPADRAISVLQSFDAVVFTSAVGVKAFFDRLKMKKTPFPRKLKTFAVGPATRDALARLGVKRTTVPAVFEGETLARRMGKVAGRKILVARAEIGREILPRILKKAGADVSIVSVYRTIPDPKGYAALKRAANSSGADWMTFTSGSTAEHCLKALGRKGAKRFFDRTKTVSIGPVTSARMKRLGFAPTVEADRFTSEGIARTISRKSDAATDDALRKTLRRALREAGKIVIRRFGRVSARLKSRANLVTAADLACEQKILDIVLKKFPHHDFITEERPPRRDGGAYAWIIDPIDGTNNYAHTFPVSCISIAVVRDKTTLMGGIFDPFRNELFFAEKGKGATLNGRSIRVSKTAKLSEALLLTGFPYDRAKRGKMYLDICGRFLKICHGIRRSGSAALDLAWAAAGRVDGYWEFRLHPWDVAAGALLIREAGGILTDFDGKDFSNPATDGRTTLAANARIHSAMLRILRGKR